MSDWKKNWRPAAPILNAFKANKQINILEFDVTDLLKLYAMDADDLQVMSAALEGAITSPGEISYLSTARQLTMTVSRMRWEKPADDEGAHSRIRCGVLITDITGIRAKSIPRDTPTLGMELLSIQCQKTDDTSAVLTLIFAEDRTLELTVECVNAALTDSGEAWVTDKIPTHDLEN
jgi:hypothetical protein